MTGLLAQFLLSVFTAVVTSITTVWLSLRRFYSEKWWERKVAAYTAIIKSLHHMKRDIEENMSAEERGRELSEERKAELAKSIGKDGRRF